MNPNTASPRSAHTVRLPGSIRATGPLVHGVRDQRGQGHERDVDQRLDARPAGVASARVEAQQQQQRIPVAVGAQRARWHSGHADEHRRRSTCSATASTSWAVLVSIV